MYGLHAEIPQFYVDLFIVMSFQFYKAIRAFFALLTNQKLTRLPFFKFPAHSQLMSIIRWREQFPMKSIPMLVCSQVKLAYNMMCDGALCFICTLFCGFSSLINQQKSSSMLYVFGFYEMQTVDQFVGCFFYLSEDNIKIYIYIYNHCILKHINSNLFCIKCLFEKFCIARFPIHFSYVHVMFML